MGTRYLKNKNQKLKIKIFTEGSLGFLIIMRSYIKIVTLLMFSIFITIFVSPIIASILPFHLYRIMGRVALITTFLLFLYYRDKLGFHSIREMGFEFGRRWWLLLVTGFGLGLLSLGIISAGMLYAFIRFVEPGIYTINWLGCLTKYILIGFTVAFIEEFFFRGFIFQALLRDCGIIASLIITNLLYSIVHFLKPVVFDHIEVLNLFSSINAIGYFFIPLFKEFQNLWPSLFGLFLVGVVLSMAYRKIGQLSLPIGLHAGWIVGIKLLSLGTDVAFSDSFWLSGNVVSQPISWIVLFVFILVFDMGRFRAKRMVKRI